MQNILYDNDFYLIDDQIRSRTNNFNVGIFYRLTLIKISILTKMCFIYKYCIFYNFDNNIA